MEKTASEKIRLGVFVIVGSILLVVTAYLIGNRQNMFSSSFRISSVFKNVNGLQEGNNVRFSGINVGTVKRLEMINDTSIRVNMLISDNMLEHIGKDAIATIGSDGLVGSMIINIYPGSEEVGKIEPGDEIKSYSRVATEDILATLSVSNDNIAVLTEDLLRITESILTGKGMLARLLNDSTLAGNVSSAVSNLQRASINANAVLAEMNTTFSQLRSDDNLAAVFLTDTAAAGNVRRLLVDLESTGQGMTKATSDLSEVVEEMKNGKGAFHLLATDTGFVQSLDSTMSNLEKGSALLNEDLEALKHSALLRGYFRKQEKRARKEERSK